MTRIKYAAATGILVSIGLFACDRQAVPASSASAYPSALYDGGQREVAQANMEAYDGGPGAIDPGTTNPQPGTGLYDAGVGPENPMPSPGANPTPETYPGEYDAGAAPGN
jgi:hypothetical protein